MIAIDTNVLARAILQDDKLQSPKGMKAIANLASGEGVLITHSVVLELAWVLKKTKHPVEIYEILLHLLESEGISFINSALIGEALEIFRAGKIDFGDALLIAEAKAYGVTKVMTFDEALLKSNKETVPVR